MSSATPPLISVITSTLNSAGEITVLIQSLKAQTYTNFEWVVVDSCSNDRTCELVSAVCEFPVILVSEPDFGIYHALNKGISVANADYYIVAGSDDKFNSNALENYANITKESDFDIISSLVQADNQIMRPQKRHAWMYGMKSYISCHSVGLMVKKSLHKKYGYYSKLFPICADKYFVLSAIVGGASLHNSPFVAGVYASSGTSSINKIASLTEDFRVNLSVGFNPILQYVLLCARLAKFLFILKYRK